MKDKPVIFVDCHSIELAKGSLFVYHGHFSMMHPQEDSRLGFSTIT